MDPSKRREAVEAQTYRPNCDAVGSKRPLRWRLKGKAGFADLQITRHPAKLVIRRDHGMGWSGIIVDDQVLRVGADEVWIRIGPGGAVTVTPERTAPILQAKVRSSESRLMRSCIGRWGPNLALDSGPDRCVDDRRIWVAQTTSAGKCSLGRVTRAPRNPDRRRSAQGQSDTSAMPRQQPNAADTRLTANDGSGVV